jgi:hypothetical protein
MKTFEGAMHVTGVYFVRVSPKGLAFKNKNKKGMWYCYASFVCITFGGDGCCHGS